MNFGSKAFAGCLALFLASPVAAATIDVEFWDTDNGSSDPANNVVDNLNDALSIVEGVNQRVADQTFNSSGIDYPTGSVGGGVISSGQYSTLSGWLGADALSLSGDGSISMLGSVFRFTGQMMLSAGINALSVGSDDGYRLRIGGVDVNSVDATRPFATDYFNYNAAADGLYDFELVYYEDNTRHAGVEFKNGGEVVAPVPIPAGGLLLLTAIGGLGVARRRKTSS